MVLTEPKVQEFLASHREFREWLEGLSSNQQVALLSVLSIGQGPLLFSEFERAGAEKILEHLMVLEEHYDTIGGVVGYHRAVMELLTESKSEMNYSRPPFIDLREGNSEAVLWGLQALPQMGEIYPIGGAGDRLDLMEGEEPLPAARLPFAGHSLLEGLIRDLQARELLYEKVFGVSLTTPIAMMTSHEKHNHKHVFEICERANWWGRPKESFAFFSQERVPMITEEGVWALKAPYELYLKPGGHGVLWKLMDDAGIFDWFADKERTKALVRQINNPIAGTDDTLLAFAGIGWEKEASFGFVGCERRCDASEGAIVQFEKPGGIKGITNIEYTQKIEGILPANTNILFVDLQEVQAASEHCPLPGMLVNMKKTAPCLQPDGTMKELHVGRLETMMQNIAEYLVGNTFVTYHKRRKALSVTKQSWSPGSSTEETPVGCEEVRVENNRDLLTNCCHFALQGKFHLTYHPALGPLWSIIGQKIQRGTLSAGAEMQLEIAELEIQNLNLTGSLLITSSDLQGKCRLIDVTIENEGIDWEGENILWKNQVARLGALEIILEGDGEFYAEGVTFRGNEKIVVPAGHRVVAEEQDGSLLLTADPLEAPWSWTYSVDGDQQIVLSL